MEICTLNMQCANVFQAHTVTDTNHPTHPIVPGESVFSLPGCHESDTKVHPATCGDVNRWVNLPIKIGVAVSRWKPGYAEKMYDLSVFCGLNPVPWQFDLLQRIENHDVDETFREMVMA